MCGTVPGTFQCQSVITYQSSLQGGHDLIMPNTPLSLIRDWLPKVITARSVIFTALFLSLPLQILLPAGCVCDWLTHFRNNYALVFCMWQDPVRVMAAQPKLSSNKNHLSVSPKLKMRQYNTLPFQGIIS